MTVFAASPVDALPVSNGPNGFIRHDNTWGEIRSHTRKSEACLRGDNVTGFIRFILGKRLPHTNDRGQVKFLRGEQSLVHSFIRLAKIGAAFRVAKDDIVAQFLDHRRRDLTSECAFFLPI
jgi:hypothetical protein